MSSELTVLVIILAAAGCLAVPILFSDIALWRWRQRHKS